MASREFCRFFPPMGVMNKLCLVGIEIQSVADKAVTPLLLPCCNPSAAHLCTSYAPYTEEEISQTNAEVAKSLNKIGAFDNGDDRTCPICGAAIETITLYEKSEPDMYSLYTQPCNHRHGLWRTAPSWAVDAGIVHVIPLEMDEEDL
jgi:hypothetical protein